MRRHGLKFFTESKKSTTPVVLDHPQNQIKIVGSKPND